MTKKKAKQRRQQQRRQRRAVKRARRTRHPAAARSPQQPKPVLFEQDEAAAIASMMTDGAEDFANRIGAVLQYSEHLLDEPEFADLSIDDLDFWTAAIPVLEAHSDELDAAEQASEAAARKVWLDITGETAARLVQSDFHNELLERLNRFVERARDVRRLRAKWTSAVALKFLLEQPPAGDQAAIWRHCELMHQLVEDVLSRSAEQQQFEDMLLAAIDTDEMPEMPELLDLLDEPSVLDQMSAWYDAHPEHEAEADADMERIEDMVTQELIDDQWAPGLFTGEEIAIFAGLVLQTADDTEDQQEANELAVLDLAKTALAEITSPQWYTELSSRLRARQKEAAGRDREDLERWLGVELLVARFEQDLKRCPTLIAALINEYNAMLENPAAHDELRSALQQRFPELTAEQVERLFESEEGQ